MESSDKPAFAAIINGLAAIKPGGKITPEALEVYWLAMRDWPLKDFREAAAHLARSVEFMPNPFHFDQLRKAGKLTTGEAFAKARAAMRAAMPGELPSLSCGDPAIDSAIRACGGYEAFAMVETDKIGFFERRFAEHYEAVSDSTAVREALPFVEQQKLTGPRKLLGAA